MQTIKEVEKIIEETLKGVEYEVKLYDDGYDFIFAVSYTDFISRKELRKRLREKIGGDIQLAISRNYSERAIKEFLFNIYKTRKLSVFCTEDAASGVFEALPLRQYLFKQLEDIELCDTAD